MRRRKLITLTLTQFCNLRCSYCYEANKSYRKMNFDIVKEILDRDLNDSNFDEYEIDFFGGEPFLEFELIKQTFEYVAKTYPNKLLLFTATTNGTLVHDEIQEWLKQHKNIFKVALSLDGTKRMHDINRCSSFDRIDLNFFKEVYPEQMMKMTVSAETLPYLSEGIIFMHENNFNFTSNLAYDIDWSNKDNKDILERELNILINYYLEHPDIKPCELLSHPISWIGMYNGEPFRQCGAGVEMTSYDVDGRSYPCQFFMPLSIGEDRAVKSKEIKFLEQIDKSNFVGECQNCIAMRLCHTCYGANYAATGNIYQKDTNWCKLQKVIFKANAYLALKRIENGTFKVPKNEEHYWYKAIKMLLDDNF